MTNVVSFNKRKAAQLKAKAKGQTLCRNGFHRWEVLKQNQFDVKQGKLITVYRCQRCAVQKIKAQ